MATHSTPLSPAPASWATRVGAIVRHVALGAVSLGRAWKHRREVNDLLRLDDRTLKDIGLVRSDVLGALAEPIGADPSIGLRLRSVENQLRQRDRADQVERLTRRAPQPGPARSVVKAAA